MEELLTNPYIEDAKKAMSPEDLERYKEIGKYMYETDIYQKAEFGEKVKEAKIEDFATYAIQGLKAGLDPMELSQKEIKALIDLYGVEWYLKFGFQENEVPKFNINLKDLKISRQYRRLLERKVSKARKADRKNKEK